MGRALAEFVLRLAYFSGAAAFIVVAVTGCVTKREDSEISAALLISLVVFLLAYAALVVWFPRPKIKGNE